MELSRRSVAQDLPLLQRAGHASRSALVICSMSFFFSYLSHRGISLFKQVGSQKINGLSYNQLRCFRVVKNVKIMLTFRIMNIG